MQPRSGLYKLTVAISHKALLLFPKPSSSSHKDICTRFNRFFLSEYKVYRRYSIGIGQANVCSWFSFFESSQQSIFGVKAPTLGEGAE